MKLRSLPSDLRVTMKTLHVQQIQMAILPDVAIVNPIAQKNPGGLETMGPLLAGQSDN